MLHHLEEPTLSKLWPHPGGLHVQVSDLVYKLKKIVGTNNFLAQFIKIISHYKKIGYNINVL